MNCSCWNRMHLLPFPMNVTITVALVLVDIFHKINIFIAQNFFHWNYQCEHNKCIHYFCGRNSTHQTHTGNTTKKWEKIVAKSNRTKKKKWKKLNAIFCATQNRQFIIIIEELNGRFQWTAAGRNSFLGLWHCKPIVLFFVLLLRSRYRIWTNRRIKMVKLLWFNLSAPRDISKFCGFEEILLLNANEHSATFLYI